MSPIEQRVFIIVMLIAFAWLVEIVMSEVEAK